MILTDQMLSLAFDIRDAQPWNFLDDSCIFAVSLSTGETGYVCVMGHAGEHFAIGLYIGQRGFSSYLKSLTLDGDSHVEMMEQGMSMDYINCDFENAAEMEPESKKRVKAYAETSGRKIRRPRGWPDFVRHIPFKPLSPIQDEADAQAITEALQAVLALTQKLSETNAENLGFDAKRKYPTAKGGKVVPLLIPDKEGGFSFGTTTLPAVPKNEYKPTPFNNDILIHAVSELPKGRSISCKFFHLPQAVSGDGDASFMPVMLCVSETNGMAYPVMPSENNIDDLTFLLANLAVFLTSQKKRPSEIFVSEERTQALLKDFCKRCGIKLSLSDYLPELEYATTMLYTQMSML